MLRLSILAVLLLAPLLTHAGVNPRNGNFYISYTDVVLAARGHKLDLVRTYNSKAAPAGWFGYGWGSTLETRLTVMPDGTAVISENGSGANSFYRDETAAADTARVAAGVERIVAAAVEKDKLDAQAAEAMRQKLLHSEEERLHAVRKYQVQSELPDGKILKGIGRGYCAGVLQQRGGGYRYRRDTGCGTVEYFDREGHLISRVSADGYHVDLRIEQGRPVHIVDSDGQQIFSSWTQDGQISRLTASDGTVVEYEYDNNRNLISSHSLREQWFYRHDYDRHHNMTRVRYADGTAMYVTYDPKSAATSITERDGKRTLYEYSENPDDPNDYHTHIRSIDEDGSESHDGVSFHDDISETGTRTLQDYSVHKRNKQDKTEFDEKGRVKRKTKASGEFIAYTYDEASGKIARVNINDQIGANFRYNKAGDLIHAETTLGESFDLEYDENKHISHMVSYDADGKPNDLRFKYNAKGKPIEIQPKGMSPITVQYDEQGSVVKVESRDGAKAALRITRAFQTMLTVVKLASCE